MRKKCKVEGCERLHDAKGYCIYHCRQYKKYGKIIKIIPDKRDSSQGCLVDGCDAPHEAKGYCSRHYSQILKHGKIVFIERVLSPKIGLRKRGGYIYVLNYEHPRADKRGYVKRSWLIWERQTGHIVTPPEIVHHKNGIRDDDDFNNLKLLPNLSAHAKEHGGRIGGIRIVTKDMAIEEMRRVYTLIGKPFTTRRFAQHSSISKSVIARKFGWNALKEELCIP